ncbi:DUF2029 domain-containing protein [Frigoribacterium sp. CFBP 8759]|uniref:glycosyltransferase 87 family protein n=1 Tax=Frigoribacterium sp. CFBP 8759 TaxID=2775283 RepID=UPI001784DFF8|nr:glycosyltransferase 87 family protein [Frigoribacterium sp. CFBP 8759]MBD8485266.1 DUF2029 domain-containing protein [Frigoribacterium sp. CFBP 8759]
MPTSVPPASATPGAPIVRAARKSGTRPVADGPTTFVDRARSFVTSPVVLGIAFVLVHAWLVRLNLVGGNRTLGDVDVVYRTWMQQGVGGGDWVGVDRPWVYPLLAAVPMLLARLGGDSGYGAVWLVLVSLLNAGAFVVLVARRRAGSVVAAWWWLAFLVALGPIALGRIDAVTVSIALVGLLLVSTRPSAASALLTIAAWVKVWPAALVVVAVLALRRRVEVVVAAAVTSAVVVSVSLVLGSGWNVFGFIGQQAGRGLQVESPAAVLWLWRAAAGVPGTFVYYDREILTYQIAGDGVGFAAKAMSLVMAAVVLGIVLLGLRAVRRGVTATRLLGPLSLAVVVALIVTNKVGSPQFVAWLAVPVVVGLVLARSGGPRFVVPAVAAVVVAGLTQVVYPLEYDALLAARPDLVAVVTVRAVLELGLLGWTVVTLWRLRPVHARMDA